MRRESHVRFCEGGGVRFPSATRLTHRARLLSVIPNEVGRSWEGVGEGSPRSDLSGLAPMLLLNQITTQVRPLGIRLL
jgi:hypothetical protein